MLRGFSSHLALAIGAVASFALVPQVFASEPIPEPTVQQCTALHQRALAHRYDRLRRIEEIRAWIPNADAIRQRYAAPQAELLGKLMAGMKTGFARDTLAQELKLLQAFTSAQNWERANPTRQGNGHNVRQRNVVGREAQAMLPFLERDFLAMLSRVTGVPPTEIAQLEAKRRFPGPYGAETRWPWGNIPARQGFELSLPLQLANADGSTETANVRFHLYLDYEISDQWRLARTDARGTAWYENLGPKPKFQIVLTNLSELTPAPENIVQAKQAFLRDMALLPESQNVQRGNYMAYLRYTTSRPWFLAFSLMDGSLDSHWSNGRTPEYFHLDTSTETMRRDLDTLKIIYSGMLFMPNEACIRLLGNSGEVPAQYYTAYAPVLGEVWLPPND